MTDNDHPTDARPLKRKRLFVSIVTKVLIFLCLCGVLTAAGVGIFVYNLAQDLPSIAPLKDYRPSIITKVFSDDDTLIDEFYLEDRKIIEVTLLPKYVIQAFVAAEDARYFQHGGVDIKSIARAFFKNIEAGHIVQGGSTITQQVAKSLFLTPKKSYIRKLREAILSYKIEKYLEKYEILNLYLNHIYLGHGAYGIESAAQKYFAKNAVDLTLGEAALLAGLPKAPSWYSPNLHPKRARSRQAYVLERMAEDGYITDKEKTEALSAPLVVRESSSEEKIAPYFTENVRRYVQKKYGSDVLYKEGLAVYTTLNIDMQRAAREAVEQGLRELDKRQGYRGPIRRIPKEEFDAFIAETGEKLGDGVPENAEMLNALVTSVDSENKTVTVRIGQWTGTLPVKNMKWARVPNPAISYKSVEVTDPADVLQEGYVIAVRIVDIDTTEDEPRFTVALEQKPEVQGALICMDAKTGTIKAMVGGRDYDASEFNRATQACRQPGSAFKPIIYTAAFDKGLTPATVVMDSPIIYRDTLKDSLWKPQNFSEKFYGPTILRTALINSRNLVTIKIAKDIGVDYIADYARNMGIESPLSHDLSMALGSSAVTLEELVRTYSVFANSGRKTSPIFIRKIVDRTGHVLEENEPHTEQVVDPRIAYITTHLLEEVVQRGTGWRIRALGRPVAGKTGTTNEQKDAWFIGFTPSIITGTWVGFDDLKPLGKYETGSRAASPIFLYFMEKALAGMPVESFPVPDGVVFSRIDPETGLLASPDAKDYVFQAFLEGTEPVEYAADSQRKADETLKSDLDNLMQLEQAR